MSISSRFSARDFTDMLRLSLAYLVMLVFFLLNLAAFPVPVIGEVNPFFMLMAVYYWSVFRPTMVPPVFCFFVGLATDLLSGGVLGLNAVLLVMTQWLISSQRRFLMGQPYLMMWLAFGLVASLVGILRWALQSLALWEILPPVPLIVSTGATFLLFPSLTLLLIGLHRLLPDAQKPYS